MRVLHLSECSEKHPCEGLSKHAHFRNFGMAFLTLFRVATGDNWNGIMKVSITTVDQIEVVVGPSNSKVVHLYIKRYGGWTTFEL